jgi:hypothetical protein
MGAVSVAVISGLAGLCVVGVLIATSLRDQIEVAPSDWLGFDGAEWRGDEGVYSRRELVLHRDQMTRTRMIYSLMSLAELEPDTFTDVASVVAQLGPPERKSTLSSGRAELRYVVGPHPILYYAFPLPNVILPYLYTTTYLTVVVSPSGIVERFELTE